MDCRSDFLGHTDVSVVSSKRCWLCATWYVAEVSFGVLELASKELGIVMDPTSVEVKWHEQTSNDHAENFCGFRQKIGRLDYS